MTDIEKPFCEDGTHHFELKDGKSSCQHCGLLYDAYIAFKEELEAKAKQEKKRRRMEKQKLVEKVNESVQ